MRRRDSRRWTDLRAARCANRRDRLHGGPQTFSLVAADGGVFSFGNAAFYGSMGGAFNAPVVGITATPDGKGYWLVAADGGVFSFGDAVFAGSMGGSHLNGPVVGIAANPDGKGYWLAAADGGVFPVGRSIEGSIGGKRLNAPVVSTSPRLPDMRSVAP